MATPSDSGPYEYDLIVIGGGSGGVACAKAAGDAGAKVLCFDYVTPSPRGTSWGLGGTCVNVGCIPKKLMHRAAAIGGDIADAPSFGWEGVDRKAAKINWSELVQRVQNHVRRLSFGYRGELRSKGVTYIPAIASFKDPHTIAYKQRGEEKTVTGKYIVIACGGRPTYPDVPGAKEYCITSDDLFSLSTEPGKVLCVGASYVSLECAGFLTELGFDTTVMVRSILLRGFDQEIAEKVGAYMEEHGTKFQKEQTPVAFAKKEDGKIIVKSTGKLGDKEEEFDTVLLATGRTPVSEALNLEAAGVKMDARTKKIPVDKTAATNVPFIYCIGDAQLGAPELTPTAILSGKILAKRLFGGSLEEMVYTNVPTAVFTPLEYGSIGLPEENAKAIVGESNVVVYHGSFTPLEWAISDERSHEGEGYVKVICDKTREETVMGLHYLGPNAAEVINGWAPSLRLGVRKRDLERVVGIHPCCAEEINNVSVIKGSGVSEAKGGC
ncbi:Thioredoxin-disulfide reductase [Monocercomonoides exilis]|uniref:Thioredoxin-disulfide reductase n=1 Tax=Monocercomonoides exilis TaxID=2049356 RepID=UPI003559A3DB|nr:Thioredoxin-disulfide reductase [Monocercomonoides exilis]|eukprot:MONOS_8700.1-p1 / transcript=MONOS_8700.1 / gene=MONOS_8700 / organism=Monocercomonoides_exilis_PA203 / gene_product=Thioredoxin-disulfide reductase [EC:1.8.1.9] / transcript_product=Thioredoxin-disulfide reductase [EC:1.8.1.9] / location=Mono_scaffold00335:15969-17453(-) / protein_length=495 / sequence_SO=supercontig / SO=protein_coding / is_pseudo=false